MTSDKPDSPENQSPPDSPRDTIPLADVAEDTGNVIFYHEHPAVTQALNYVIPDVKDSRLYVPWPERVKVQLKSDVSNEYCFQKFPGQDYYHHLLTGELYVEFNDSKYCLTCALRNGLITNNRLFWQRAAPLEFIPAENDSEK